MTETALEAGPKDCPGLVPVPVLVDPATSRRKVRRFLDDWDRQRSIYRARGWLIVEVFDDLVVDLAMTTRMPGIAPAGLDVVPVCCRIDYRNFDLWAPSVIFISLVNRLPVVPSLRAFQLHEGQLRDVLIDGHPSNNQPFLCLPGTREYHSHPQHSGDDWLLHRSQGAGNLAVIAQRLWQTMLQTLNGLAVAVQAPNPPMQGQLVVQLLQTPGPMSFAPVVQAVVA